MALSTMNYLLIIMCKKQRENVEIIDKHINIVMLVSESFVLFIQFVSCITYI